jgi:hypothetical protein
MADLEEVMRIIQKIVFWSERTQIYVDIQTEELQEVSWVYIQVSV